MQSITLFGRLGADPERRTTSGGKSYVTFNIAPQQARDEEATWYSCSAFGQAGEVVENFSQKGALICVSGQLKVNVKGDKTYLNVTVNQVTLGPKAGDSAPSRPAPTQGGAAENDTYNPFDDD